VIVPGDIVKLKKYSCYAVVCLPIKSDSGEHNGWLAQISPLIRCDASENGQLETVCAVITSVKDLLYVIGVTFVGWTIVNNVADM
jgi:hypothetical protein